MNKILSKMLLLILITSITSITLANASLQIVTIDVVPDNAGTVQVYKNYGTATHTFMGWVTTTKNFDFDTSDMISIIPFNDDGSEYKFVKQCDHVECINGLYYGGLYSELLLYKISVYYEIPSDKENPTINGIALSTTTPYMGDYIDIMITATDNVGVTKVTADGVQFSYNGNSWNGKIQAIYSGTHTISIVAYDAVGNYILDGSKSYNGTVKLTTSTLTPTPTINLTPIPTLTPTLTPTPPIICCEEGYDNLTSNINTNSTIPHANTNTSTNTSTHTNTTEISLVTSTPTESAKNDSPKSEKDTKDNVTVENKDIQKEINYIPLILIVIILITSTTLIYIYIKTNRNEKKKPNKHKQQKIDKYETNILNK